MIRTATHRLQLTPDLGFDEAAQLVPTLARLGISHLYLSPVAEAVPGSRHGYDVVDHTRVRAELGGPEGLERLLDAAADAGLGVLVDHVPNHVSVERAELNAPWWEVLRDGPDSPAARWFDVDWAAADGRVIVPKLGDPLDDVLAAGGLEVGEGDLGPEVRYGPLRFPVAPGTGGLDLPELLERQSYRLAWWRDPSRNVRRFFTIDDLVAVRVEHDEVAEQVDSLPARLADHPAFDGVRVDHVDGLAEPGAYLAGLRDRIGAGRWLLVEKILAPDEVLPASWPVDGTTGYEHVRAVEHTLLDPSAEAPLTAAWRRDVDDRSFDELEREARREVLDGGLAPDLERLVRTAIAAGGGDGDEAADGPRSAFVELTLALHRYRTYLPDDPASTDVLASARERARSAATGERGSEIDRAAQLVEDDPDVRTRWQQLTGPVMAKGAEDRAFYRSFALASLAEVGGMPGTFTTSVDDFHEFQRARQAERPEAMLAETTHDTKRSGAVRARSLALAAGAEAWVDVSARWRAAHGDVVDGLDPGIVSLAMQTAVTARPLTVDRLHDYLVKSAREGDVITSWTEPDEAVESALRRLAEALLGATGDGDATADDERADVDRELAEAATRHEVLGAELGLAMLALHLTCPGVPDLYQGSPRELTSLVDPDNRVEPDADELRDLVAAVDTDDTDGALDAGRVDLARTILTERLLRLRRRRPDAFGPDAGYVELEVDGDGAEHVIAFARATEGEPMVVTVAVRALATPLDGAATQVTLPEGSWRSLLADDARVVTGGPTRLADLVGDRLTTVLDRTDR